jgi:hypothetical protein
LGVSALLLSQLLLLLLLLLALSSEHALVHGGGVTTGVGHWHTAMRMNLHTPAMRALP